VPVAKDLLKDELAYKIPLPPGVLRPTFSEIQAADRQGMGCSVLATLKGEGPLMEAAKKRGSIERL